MPFPKQDIKNPEDFENMAKLVRIENYANRMLISADLEEHTAQIQQFVDMGFEEIYLHNVGRDQAGFIAAFGEQGPAQPEPGLARPSWTSSSRPIGSSSVGSPPTTSTTSSSSTATRR